MNIVDLLFAFLLVATQIEEDQTIIDGDHGGQSIGRQNDQRCSLDTGRQWAGIVTSRILFVKIIDIRVPQFPSIIFGNRCSTCGVFIQAEAQHLSIVPFEIERFADLFEVAVGLFEANFEETDVAHKTRWAEESTTGRDSSVIQMSLMRFHRAKHFAWKERNIIWTTGERKSLVTFDIENDNAVVHFRRHDKLSGTSNTDGNNITLVSLLNQRQSGFYDEKTLSLLSTFGKSNAALALVGKPSARFSKRYTRMRLSLIKLTRNALEQNT